MNRFSIEYVSCPQYGVVLVTDDELLLTGTVCGNVDNTTANYICDKSGYGSVVEFGTARSKG